MNVRNEIKSCASSRIGMRRGVCAWESAAHVQCFVTRTKNLKIEKREKEGANHGFSNKLEKLEKVKRERRKGRNTGLVINSLSSRIRSKGMMRLLTRTPPMLE